MARVQRSGLLSQHEVLESELYDSACANDQGRHVRAQVGHHHLSVQVLKPPRAQHWRARSLARARGTRGTGRCAHLETRIRGRGGAPDRAPSAHFGCRGAPGIRLHLRLPAPDPQRWPRLGTLSALAHVHKTGGIPAPEHIHALPFHFSWSRMMWAGSHSGHHGVRTPETCTPRPGGAAAR